VGEIVPLSRVAVQLDTEGNRDIRHRPDGKPLANGMQISRSHCGSLTMTVTSGAVVGCDCEPVRPRTEEMWRDLLGSDGLALAALLAREAREDLDKAATRVWCGMESMKKAGARQDLGIVLATPEEQTALEAGWVLLGVGTWRIATFIAPVTGFTDAVAFAVLVGS
jgi:enediyne polyketide synthase